MKQVLLASRPLGKRGEELRLTLERFARADNCPAGSLV